MKTCQLISITEIFTLKVLVNYVDSVMNVFMTTTEKVMIMNLGNFCQKTP